MNKKICKFTLLLLVLSFTISGCEKKEEVLLPVVTVPADDVTDPAVSSIILDENDNNKNTEETISETKNKDSTNKDNTTNKEQTNPASAADGSDIFYIHIYGAVVRPGVYEVPAGSRIFEVVEAAFGFTEDAATDAVNLAMLAEDGSKIMIPTWEEAREAEEAGLSAVQAEVPSGTDNSPWVSTPNGSAYPGTAYLPEEQNSLVNINTASLDLLCTLPGIGKAKAESIISYREEQGGFQHVEDIMKVAGIKEGLFDQISDKITV